MQEEGQTRKALAGGKILKCFERLTLQRPGKFLLVMVDIFLGF